MKNKIIISVVLIGLVVAGRLMPHVWNATPLIAVCLLAGYVLPRKWAIGVPLVAMFISSLASSTFFFITTNFAVWASGTWYPKTSAGLLLAYEMGIPFFRNMALGDLVFSGVMFGAWIIMYNVENKKITNKSISQKIISNYNG
ncbi:MAG: hypothetical protein UV47_C0010G0012 [Parcubacteria group bacterium GW2011_GWA2_42_80]|nr:MAG: hypothetical protein UV47_C0010G0012 [Parcubacteria group bacterium GW2011_GWA2_42_80]